MRTLPSRLLLAPALFITASLIMTTGCAKKQIPTPIATAPAVQPTPAPAAPTISFNASPASIQKGQTAQLNWQTQNATDVQLQSIGSVSANGSRQVSPDASTTYTIIAKGPGGTTQATADVNVAQPITSNPQSIQDLFHQSVKDVFFAYDKSLLDTEDTQLIASDASFLQAHPDLKFTVEGHCDERGSEEYNLALGANRAEAVRQALIAQGVQADRINTISYGKEKPFCTDSNEECWHLNRRGHFALPQ